MTLDTLINRMAKSKYTFSGAWFASATTFPHRGGRPLRFQFECLHDAESIQVEGGCLRDAGAPPHAFTLEIPFGQVTADSVPVKIRSPEFSELSGLIVFTMDGFELLASSAAGEHGSLHLRYFSDSDFEVSGMLMLAGRSVAFVAREGGQWDRVVQAKVIPLQRRSQ